MLIPPGLFPERVRVLLNKILRGLAGKEEANTFSQAQTFSAGVQIGSALVTSGAGSPLGVVEAPVGSIFLRSDGGASTTLYVKESGSDASGWVAK